MASIVLEHKEGIAERWHRP